MEDLFTVHQFKVQYDHLGQKIPLYPFGDVHWGSHNCAETIFDTFLEGCKKNQGYYLGTGDYIDLLSWSERRAISQSGLHDTTLKTLDDLLMKQVNEFCKKIEFMRGRIIGMVEGNHFGTLSSSGVSTTQIICEKMGCRYLGGSSFIKLSFSKTGLGRTRNCIKIWVHHGRFSSRKSGGSVNTVEDMIMNATADIYLSAHDHRKWVVTRSILDLTTTGHAPKLHHKKILLGRTGSFQKGYMENSQSFVAHKQLSPADLGSIVIEMTPTVENRFYEDEIGNEHREQLTYIDLHGWV